MNTIPSPSGAPRPATLPTTVLGYPRIGPDREMKKALEAYWGGGDPAALSAALSSQRERTLQHLQGLGLRGDGAVPADGAAIDQVLDAAVLLGVVPARFRAAGLRPVDPDSHDGLALVSALARGTEELAPLELTKWFDTNYHYYVPELEPGARFAPQGEAVARRYRAFADASADLPRLTLLGPVSFLLLAKVTTGALEGGAAHGRTDPRSRLDLLPDLCQAYATLLQQLRAAGASWVQLEEPALASDGWDVPREPIIAGTAAAYRQLAAVSDRPNLFVPVSYGAAGAEVLEALGGSGVEAVGIDLERGEVPTAAELAPLRGITLAAGVVGGRNIWRTDATHAVRQLDELRERHRGPITVSTATSLQHVPHDVARERALDPEIACWLAFADQKITEVLSLASHLHGGSPELESWCREDADRRARRAQHPRVHVAAVRDRLAAVHAGDRRRGPSAVRREAQQAALQLPPLPTTTIGSFPQTAQIRRLRAAHRRGELGQEGYVDGIREQIAQCVAHQEQLGLDVLVHGEAERNDMVQYFAELLEGFVTTTHGWVQSYGSRCLRPPVLFGDVHRPQAMTVEWTRFAASLTSRPVKGMLTGPVTILAWSFVRDDQPLSETSDQIALALRDEVDDLQRSGTQIIQVDEPALRELLPLREADRPEYLRWSVDSFRLATGSAGAETQIHTHLCYSEFETVIEAIDALDADVTTVEASRSGFEVVSALARHGFSRGIGPGVWDIHSPRVPSVDELTERLRLAVSVLGAATVWSNPDCGLKTRGWPETTASLENLVRATAAVRAEIAAPAVPV
ncbi:5-methyltetrahydropteroyltriglutamate--homocysteine S-methyltransferase [Bogoriella caseilytica]|uniref:5-methyltetrahydropteroyltriglutamate--homocysteine S-methyltransferase n=1 Tax=Bogoriella caseilytica TaxID=56055 RepID=A0A3N2BG04_9MICO|nr:5-methyltetrahydropteroyltriglutamate--homocysteine S-methyltransferase [Bogoriella caseilytica]ROR74150.1 methionine synthase (B12-independent) [Bogoriella caseilytica]